MLSLSFFSPSYLTVLETLHQTHISVLLLKTSLLYLCISFVFLKIGMNGNNPSAAYEWCIHISQHLKLHCVSPSNACHLSWENLQRNTTTKVCG